MFTISPVHATSTPVWIALSFLAYLITFNMAFARGVPLRFHTVFKHAYHSLCLEEFLTTSACILMSSTLKPSLFATLISKLGLQKEQLSAGTPPSSSVAASWPAAAAAPSSPTAQAVSTGISLQELKAGYDAEVAELRSQLAAEKKQAETRLTSQKAQLKALVSRL